MEWIKCSERMPKRNGAPWSDMMLAWTAPAGKQNRGYAIVAEYHFQTDTWVDNNDFVYESENVTHYQPIIPPDDSPSDSA